MTEREKLLRYSDLLVDLTLSLYNDKSINDENKKMYYETSLHHVARCLYGMNHNLSIKQLPDIGIKELLKEFSDVH